MKDGNEKVLNSHDARYMGYPVDCRTKLRANCTVYLVR